MLVCLMFTVYTVQSLRYSDINTHNEREREKREQVNSSRFAHNQIQFYGETISCKKLLLVATKQHSYIKMF